MRHHRLKKYFSKTIHYVDNFEFCILNNLQKEKLQGDQRPH